MLHVILLLDSEMERWRGTVGGGREQWLCSTGWENGNGLIFGDPRERDRGKKGR